MSRLDLRPLDEMPISIRAPFDVRRPILYDLEASLLDYLDALMTPLAGVELGTHDHRMIAWLAGWDTPTVGTVASLLHRARAAGPLIGGGS